MPFDPQRLTSLVMPSIEHSYTVRDVIFHALSIGFNPSGDDGRELDYVYERSLKVSPSIVLTWGFRSLSTLGLGIDFRQVVHMAQVLEVSSALPAQGTVVCQPRISAVWDLGSSRGAVLEIEREFREQDSSRLLATTRMSALCRADGGFGGVPPPARETFEPDRAPDCVFQWATLPQQAALYRLQGDMNPLHIDPSFAVTARFERPILHGLATLGGCVRALLVAVLGHEPHRLQSCEARFSAPIYPGETLQVEIWWTGPLDVAFVARALERDVLVLRHGRAQFRS